MRRSTRFGPSLTASLFCHAAGLAIAAYLTGGISRSSHDPVPPPSPATTARVVWLRQPGPGGGGGGGGNRLPTPPRPAETRGHQGVSVPASTAVTIAEPTSVAREPDPIQRIDMPAQRTGLSPDIVIGTIQDATATDPRSQGAGHDGGAGGGRGPGDGSGRGGGEGPGQDGGLGGRIYQPGNGVMPPIELRRAAPRYTAGAMHARLQGTVLIECVVEPTGVCSNVRVARSLDRNLGLDEEAIRAAGEWRFRPGTRLGKPVPVLVTLEMTFTIR